MCFSVQIQCEQNIFLQSNAQKINYKKVKSSHLFTEKPPNKSSMRIVVDAESRKRTIGAGDGGVPTKKTWFDKWVTVNTVLA